MLAQVSAKLSGIVFFRLLYYVVFYSIGQPGEMNVNVYVLGNR